jgi:hypothetical protein
MELISTDDFFILQHLQRSDTSLWVCRKTGKFSVRPPWDLSEQENPECLGLVWGLYGKLDIHPDVCQRLVLVRRCDRVGEIPGPRLRRHAVYRVGDVVLVPLVPPNLVPGDVPLSQQLGLKPCPKHHGGECFIDFTKRSYDKTAATRSSRSTGQFHHWLAFLKRPFYDANLYFFLEEENNAMPIVHCTVISACIP